MGVSLLSLAFGFIGSGVFQSLSIERTWRADVLATKEWRNAGAWLAGDALNAIAIDLTDGAPSANSVVFNWSGSSGALHTATYSLVDTDLVRNLDGAQLVVAREVVDVGFSLAGKMVTFDLEVEAEAGATESVQLQTYMRMLK